MKFFLLLNAILMIFALELPAQVLYPTQPKNGYYEDLKALIIPVVPSESELINAKTSALPLNFKDTLLKYDWYEIASYYIYEKKYESYFSKDLTEREKNYANNEFGFKRYTPEGITYEMKLDRYQDGSIKVFTTTFDETNAEKLLDVKKVGTKNMMETTFYGETEMQEILSYNKGLMVKKIKQTPNTTTRVFIIAYKAVPKSF
jgi:hypothetical protein